MFGRELESDTPDQHLLFEGGSQLGIDAFDAPGILDIIDSIQEPLCSHDGLHHGVNVQCIAGCTCNTQDVNLLDVVDSLESGQYKAGRNEIVESQVRFRVPFKKHTRLHRMKSE